MLAENHRTPTCPQTLRGISTVRGTDNTACQGVLPLPAGPFDEETSHRHTFQDRQAKSTLIRNGVADKNQRARRRCQRNPISGAISLKHSITRGKYCMQCLTRKPEMNSIYFFQWLFNGRAKFSSCDHIHYVVLKYWSLWKGQIKLMTDVPLTTSHLRRMCDPLALPTVILEWKTPEQGWVLKLKPSPNALLVYIHCFCLVP